MFVDEQPGKYAEVVLRLEVVVIIYLSEDGPRVVNGIFCVPGSGSKYFLACN